jgi:hypothetical protein
MGWIRARYYFKMTIQREIWAVRYKNVAVHIISKKI